MNGPRTTAERTKAGLKKVRTGASGAQGAAYVLEYGLALQFVRANYTMHRNVKTLGKAVMKFEKIAKTQGGAAGREAAEKLPELRKAYQAAKAAHDEQKTALRTANQFVQEYKKVGDKIGSKSPYMAKQAKNALRALAPYAQRWRTALEGSKIGQGALRTGRLIAHPVFKKCLTVFVAAVEGVISYLDSPAATQGGKVANGVVGGAAGVLPLLSLPVAIVDFAAPTGYKPTQHFRGTAAAVTVIGEAMLTDDTKGLDNFHKKSLNGDYGVVMQASSEAGDYWNKHGVAGGLSLFWEALTD